MKSNEIIAGMPSYPGVYIFRGPSGKILYVGKAKRLKDRVGSHFRGGGDARHEAMMSEVESVDYIVTESEVDALVLEANLVRDRQPHYNVALKDDKRYPYLKVTVQEKYPRLILTRQVARDGARYFGPYTDVKSLRRTLRLLRTVFPLRTCGDLDTRRRLAMDCLSLHVKRCSGPCVHRVSAEEYRRVVEDLVLFLSGRSSALLAVLRKAMEAASARREYEKCALIRDRIAAVESVVRGRRTVNVSEPEADVLGLERRGETACVVVLKVRDGKVMGQERRFLRCGGSTSEGEILTSFIEQHYIAGTPAPRLIAIPVKLQGAGLLESWLKEVRGSKVTLRAPVRGIFRSLIEMARRNAKVAMEAREPKTAAERERPLEELQRSMELPTLPYVIDCYDISNTSGTSPVGSRVVFVGGKPHKGAYRKYRVKGAGGADDTAMMGEVVERSLARRIREGEEPPDLIVVDGGKGQVSAATAAAARVGLETVPIIGLAKANELVYVQGRKDALSLPRGGPSLKLLQRLRDEAHRFGLSYHRKRRGTAQLKSLLDEVPGVGPRRRALLIRRFGSAEAVAEATEGEIAALPGLGRATARRIKESLSNGGRDGARG